MALEEDPKRDLISEFCRLHAPNLPGAPLTNFSDGGEGGGNDMGSYFIPKQITTSEFVYLKKIITFFSILKKSLSPLFTSQKNPSVVLQPKKNPGIFYRPKESTLGQNFRFKKITWTTDFSPPPPIMSLIYVSGTPGPTL